MAGSPNFFDDAEVILNTAIGAIVAGLGFAWKTGRETQKISDRISHLETRIDSLTREMELRASFAKELDSIKRELERER